MLFGFIDSDLASVVFAWNGGTGSASISASNGGKTTIGSKGITILPAGYYLTIAGGPLYVTNLTGHYGITISGTKPDGTSFTETHRVTVSNCQVNTGSAIGVECFHLPYTLTNVTITFFLGAQGNVGSQSATVYGVSYRTKFCFILQMSQNSVESYTV